MKMSEIQAARLMLNGLGRGGSQDASRQANGYGSSTQARYGTVVSVNGDGTVTIELDGGGGQVTLRTDTPLAVGDRVVIVVQGGVSMVYALSETNRRIDASVEEAKKQFAADKARMDEHDKAMEQYEKDMAAAKDELAGMDGKISDAVKEAVSQMETPDGGNHIYASASEPTAPDGGFQAGDLWYQTNSDGQIAAVKVWNGSKWNAYDMVANSILVAGSVGSTLIADGAVTTRKITSGAVTADQIAANTITGAEIRADSVDVNEIASGDIYCKRLSAVSGTGYVEIKDGTVNMFSSSSSNLFKLGVVNGYASIQSVGNQFIALRGNSTAYGWLKIGNVVDVNGSGSDFGVKRTGGGQGTGWYYAWHQLYSNSSGSTGTVTLSHGASNFSVLAIFFKDSDNNCDVTFVRMLSSTMYADLASSYYSSGYGMYMESRTVTISGSSITNCSGRGGRGFINEGGSSYNAASNTGLIKIVAVYGLKF